MNKRNLILILLLLLIGLSACGDNSISSLSESATSTQGEIVVESATPDTQENVPEEHQIKFSGGSDGPVTISVGDIILGWTVTSYNEWIAPENGTNEVSVNFEGTARIKCTLEYYKDHAPFEDIFFVDVWGDDYGKFPKPTDNEMGFHLTLSNAGYLLEHITGLPQYDLETESCIISNCEIIVKDYSYFWGPRDGFSWVELDEVINIPGIDLSSTKKSEEIDRSQIDFYRELRKQVPYPGVRKVAYFYNFSDLDDTGKDIQTVLECVGQPPKNITNLQDWDNEYILYRVLAFTALTDVQDNKELQPIANAVEYSTFKLKEHVEETAKKYFGATVNHQSIPVVDTTVPVDEYAWIWHEIEGVYTPPIARIDYGLQPVVLYYSDEGDQYRVVAVYSEADLDWFDSGNEVELRKAIENEKIKLSNLPRYEILIDKNKNGTLTFNSCVIPQTRSQGND